MASNGIAACSRCGSPLITPCETGIWTRVYSYSFKYHIEIDWEKLFNAPAIRTALGIAEGISFADIAKNKGSLLDKYWEPIRFVEFGDSIVGRRQTWSYHDGKLVDTLSINQSAGMVGAKYPADNISIEGRGGNYIDVEFGYGKSPFPSRLKTFPIYAIRDLFLAWGAVSDGYAPSRHKIESFPPEFSALMKETGLTYSPNYYGDKDGWTPSELRRIDTAQGPIEIWGGIGPHGHRFSSEYVSLFVDMETTLTDKEILLRKRPTGI
ncbi:MAG: hypothetical protein HYX59_13985 [Elusimicrobia bacterium]|nr:hypothetical protein [Elusimicrobiota bacterium]